MWYNNFNRTLLYCVNGKLRLLYLYLLVKIRKDFFMKIKKIAALALACVLVVVSLASCGKDDKDFNYETADLSKYVTLGQYIGIPVTVEPEELTEDDIQEGIKALLNEHAEQIKITDRAVADGDTINLDYEGKLDGVAFEGGTATGASLTIGSKTLIDGFESGLVGVMPGTTVDLNLTFPTPYENNPDLAGKAVVFTCKVNYIDGGMNTPEFNDEFVASITEGTYTSSNEYLEKELKPDLLESKKEEINNKKISDIWLAVLENATFIKYPESEVKKYADDIVASYGDYAEELGVSLDALLSYMSTDMDGLKDYAENYAHSIVEEELVFKSIVKAEKLSISEEEYTEGIEKYAKGYEMTVDELKAQYTEDSIKDSLLWDKLINFLVEKAVVTVKSADEGKTSADTTAATEDTTAAPEDTTSAQ